MLLNMGQPLLIQPSEPIDRFRYYYGLFVWLDRNCLHVIRCFLTLVDHVSWLRVLQELLAHIPIQWVVQLEE